MFKIDYLNFIKLVTNILVLNKSSQLFQSITNTKPANPISVLHPRLINMLVKANLSEIDSIKLKKNNFRQNIQSNVVNIVSFLISEFKYDIVGLKFICSGR